MKSLVKRIVPMLFGNGDVVQSCGMYARTGSDTYQARNHSSTSSVAL